MASQKKRSRATLATIAFDAGLRSALVHLPVALYAPLLERGVPPQSIVVEVARADRDGIEVGEGGSGADIDKIYVGWSGMSAAPLGASDGAFSSTGSSSSASSSASVVSMSPTLSTVFSPPLQAGTSVRITLLRSPPLPTANRVDVIPLTPDDWEVLSLNADEVESNMLGQVRAAKEGMTLVVHVGRQGRTICRFRVASCDPPTQSYTSSDASLPRAVRLSTDTEIVIAPRSRQQEQDQVEAAASQQHDMSDVSPTASTTSHPQSPASASEYCARSLYRVLPIQHSWSGSNNAAVVLPNTDARILSLAFAGNLSGQGRCAITKIPCPSAPDVYSSPPKPLGSFTLGSKDRSDLKDGSGAAQKDARVPARATTSAHFAHIPENAEEYWPERHVWLSEATRSKLAVQDWDLVRFSAPAPSSSVTSRPGSPDQTSRQIDKGESSTPSLAGVSKVLDQCGSQIKSSFRSRSLRSLQISMHGRRMPRTNAGLLLTGGSGSGKTSIATILSEEVAKEHVATIFIDCAQHSEQRLSSMRHLISQWLSAAAWHSPALLVLDNLDRIVPSDQEHVDSPRSGQIAESMMQKIKEVTRDYPVFVLGIAQSVSSLHRVCSSTHVFGETIDLKAPDKDARRDIVQHLVRQRTHLQAEEDLNPVMIAAQTEGYLPADLKDLVERAVHQSAIRSVGNNTFSRRVTMDDFKEAQKGYTPLSLRDIKLTQSSTTWKDIGGLQETRRILRETLEWPSKYAKIFEKCPLRLRSGLLLYGYPGCGKTLLAGAVAKECGLNFISVKGPEILNKYIGASEKSVRDLFDRAQAARPCILFFDEFDSIAPKRGHDSTGVTDRVVNQLLTQMDGAEGLSGVYILAATSRPDLIDSALLRPGRLDKSLLCGLPEEQDRLDILQVISNEKIQLDPSVDLQEWASRTEGFSGADLQALLYNANLEAVHENMSASESSHEREGQASGKSEQAVYFFRFNDKASKTKLSGAEQQALQKRIDLIQSNANKKRNGSEEESAASKADKAAKQQSNRKSIFVGKRHLEKCFKTTRQSVPAEEQQRLENIYRQFVGERDGKFPNGEASREVGARQSLM